MSRNVRLVLLLLVVAGAGGLTALVIKARRPPPATAAHPALTITLASPQRSDWPRRIPANGPLAAWQEGIIAAEIGGLRIAEIFVDVGATVQRGQELARLSDASVNADVAEARAQVAQAEANLTEARANAERARRLAVDGTMAEQTVAQNLAAESRAVAALAAVQARLTNQELRLTQTHIRATDDGIISARQANLGAVVPVGAELFRLIRQGRVMWLAELDPAQALEVKVGQPAEVALAAGHTCAGTVELIEPTADAGTRLLRVRVALPADSGAHPGGFAQGALLLAPTPALHVPEASVVLRDGRSFVFVCPGRDRVEQRAVTIGRRQDGRVELLDGLKESEPVVTTGGAFLNDGDRVQVAP